MKVCGIEIKGSEAILVVLEGQKESFQVIDHEFKKIKLNDSRDQSQIQSFKNTVNSFLSSQGIGKVGIKGKNAIGKFSGGTTSAKIEGLIQTCDAQVTIVFPQTFNAAIKKSKVDIDDYGINKYQEEAFKVAFSILV